MTRYHLSIIGVALAALSLTACLPEEAPAQQSTRDQQARISSQAAEGLRFTGNAERDNIVRRHQLTSDPNLMGYIVLLNDAGQPIMYEGVRGKVTTSGSRLTSPDRLTVGRNGNGGDVYAVTRAPSDTGTFDTGSATFIFYFNQDGTYRQWSGQYLYSTQPIRLRTEPLVISVTAPPLPNSPANVAPGSPAAAASAAPPTGR